MDLYKTFMTDEVNCKRTVYKIHINEQKGTYLKLVIIIRMG